MSKLLSFAIGAVCGSGLLVVAGASPSGDTAWVRAVNQVIANNASVRFQKIWPPGPCFPPDPCRASISVDVATGDTPLVVNASANPPPEPDAQNPPPDPDFSAFFNPPPVPDRPASLVLQVFHPDNVTILGPDGSAASLCSGGIAVLPPPR